MSLRSEIDRCASPFGLKHSSAVADFRWSGVLGKTTTWFTPVARVAHLVDHAGPPAKTRLSGHRVNRDIILAVVNKNRVNKVCWSQYCLEQSGLVVLTRDVCS